MEICLRDMFLRVLSCFQYLLPSTSLPDSLFWYELEPVEWKKKYFDESIELFAFVLLLFIYHFPCHDSVAQCN